MTQNNPLRGWDEGQRVYVCLDGGVEEFYVREYRPGGDPELELDAPENVNGTGNYVLTITWPQVDGMPADAGNAVGRYVSWEGAAGGEISEYGDVEDEYHVGDVASERRHLMAASVEHLTAERGLSPAEATDHFLAVQLGRTSTDVAESRGVSQQAVSKNVKRAHEKLME